MGITAKPVSKMQSIMRKMENQLEAERKAAKDKKEAKKSKRQIMSVWITGDIHGNPVRLSTDSFYEQKEFSDNKDENIVIILGDFGLVWSRDGENKNEKY